MSVRIVAFFVAGFTAIAISHSAVKAFEARLPYGVGLSVLQGRTVWDGVYTEDQAKRGATVYTEKCANCHGDQLTGNDAPALVGADFSANWSDLTLNDLSERIRVTMPADNAGSLSRAQVSDIIATMLKHAEMPTGQTELASTVDALKAIKYVGTKPGK